MNIKAPLAIAACSLVLGSCAWIEKLLHPSPSNTHPNAVVCKTKECLVRITVAACAITVDIPVLGIAKGNRDVDIVWEIRSEGAVFAREKPVFFKGDRAEAARQFSEPRLLADKKFRWRDANSSPGRFEYGITVVDNGKACAPLDPTVINDM